MLLLPIYFHQLPHIGHMFSPSTESYTLQCLKKVEVFKNIVVLYMFKIYVSKTERN